MSAPLVVDLDGTLILTDMLHESVFKLARVKPWLLCCIPLWLMRGKAYLKQRLAALVTMDPSLLPYNLPLLDWLHQQKASGQRLILCTASDQIFAQKIADYLGIFDDVIASNGSLNVAGKHKAEALQSRFGQFDYAGNAQADLAVWAHARQAVVVNAPAKLLEQAKQCCPVSAHFPPNTLHPRDIWRILRAHQWAKNLLLLVPLLAAHQFNNWPAWGSIALAFLAFSLCASVVYIANDLLDLDSDRTHPRKRKRPFASGQVPLWYGALAIPVLLLGSVLLGYWVGTTFLIWMAVYFILTCVYSLGLKSLLLIDCMALALFYTLRIIAGAAAINNILSFWLLAFSVFLFLSLAFVKRYAELEVKLKTGQTVAAGRGYQTSDAPLVQTMGMVSGYAAVLVFALYLNSDAVVQHYRWPEAVWGAVLVMLFWISWIWMQTHRGKMHDDPVIFALKDRASLLAGGIFALCIAAGTVGTPW